jgi:SAM-dependent methyltransferase
LFLMAEGSRDGLSHPSYDPWRTVRINKMLEIYGLDYFRLARVLELGCGHGEIGAFFADVGADVVCLDGRRKNVDIARMKHRRLTNLHCEQCDLDEPFTHYGRFDLIIDFGLLYHLRHIDNHLQCCFEMADDIVLETVVCDSNDSHKIFFCDENREVDEESIAGVGSRPSPFYIERVAREHGFEATRYFTADLNVGDQFVYDWQHQDDDCLGGWQLRRFWRLRKSAEETTSTQAESLR